MRRLSITLLVLATALSLAVPATAKKPDNPGKPDREPAAGTTCVSPWWDGDIKDSLGEDGLLGEDGWSDDFTIILDKDTQSACVDVLTEFAGVWTVTVEVLDGDAPRALTIVPRDAFAPGDSCGGEGRRGSSVTDPWILPHPDDPREFDVIPAATVNACPGNDDGGVGEFAETVERDTDDDGVIDEPVGIVMEATGEVHPLVFLVFSQGLKKTDRIAIHVVLPDAPLP